MATPEFDVVIVGAGAAGTIVAAVLSEAGKRVLLLERGPLESFATAGHRDHLRNQRHSPYGHNVGPDIEGNPRVLVDHAGHERVLAPHEMGYQNNAAVVGGGTFVYGGQAWRFPPEDFRMASRYGVPDGSSLTDWPISYDDLAPSYDRAEWEIGVAGEGPPQRRTTRSRDYPMPPVPGGPTAEKLRAGATALGISTFTPPLLVNSVPRDGRPACIQCGSCVGFPCPSNGKNGTQNTMLPRALASGNCTLVTGAVAEEITTGSAGQVTGVRYLVTHPDGEIERREVTSRIVVSSGGAVESARLLLLSRTDRHPDGLGNAHGQVGRNLQGHYYPTAFGLFDDIVYDERGPGVTIATTDFNHDNDGVVGGGLLADDFIMLPIIFWKQAFPPGRRNWGAEGKAFMRDNYRRVMQVKGPVHEIPTADCQVSLDPRVRDRYGLPVARLSGVAHPETVRTATYMLERAKDWITAAGAREVWGPAPVPRLSGGQHQAGTCRMGTDPKQSVTDQFGKVWGHDNLFVIDGSLHPTNGGFNPVLTIMALAFRCADHVVGL